MRYIRYALIAIPLFACQQARADTALVPFNGLITPTCVLTVGTPGVLAPNPTYTQLSSKNASGLSGSVTALTTGPAFNLSTETPTAFTLAPPGSDSTFVVEYSASGATTVGLTSGLINTLLGVGLTTVAVDLTANKNSGTYAGGDYAAIVTVTCE